MRILKNHGCEIMKDRLYFNAIDHTSSQPLCTSTLHYFSTDVQFVYIKFFEDFGPLNQAMVYRYCDMMRKKLECKTLSKKVLIHYTFCGSAETETKRVNAAFLIGAFTMIYLGKSPEEVHEMLTTNQPYVTFRDASNGPILYHLSLLDCLRGLHKAILYKFFEFSSFDVNEYEYYEKVENGDFNWIVPGKFLGFCGPKAKASVTCGGYTPEDYLPYFHAHNITAVIRLNKASYRPSRFTNAHIQHYDLYFIDGSNPSDEILNKFLHICESQSGAIAVHCKAGLGRTGTLIGCYIMKHYHMSAGETIAWLRIARPGCVIGPQQTYMLQKQAIMWAEGDRLRAATGSTITATGSTITAISSAVLAAGPTVTTSASTITAAGSTITAAGSAVTAVGPAASADSGTANTLDQNELNSMASRVSALNLGCVVEDRGERQQNRDVEMVIVEVIDQILENEEVEDEDSELNKTQGDLLLDMKHRSAMSSHVKNKTRKKMTNMRKRCRSSVLPMNVSSYTGAHAGSNHVKNKIKSSFLTSCAMGSTAVDTDSDGKPTIRVTRSMTQL